MSKVSIQGDASGTGTLTIAAPNTNSNYTLTLPTNTGTVMTSASNTFSGGLTLGGDLTLDSNGIYLGGTGAANYLDDYEEGTWTPTLSYGTCTVNQGDYTKIGRLVTLTFQISNFSDTSTNAIIQVSGLPFNESTGSYVGTAAGERTDYNAPIAFLTSNFIRFNNGFGVSDFAQDVKYSDINNGPDVNFICVISYITSA